MKYTTIKRNDGRWESRIKYTDFDGTDKTKYIHDTNKTKCEEKASLFIKDHKRKIRILKRFPSLSSPEPTLNEWVDLWLKEFCENVIRERTYDQYSSRMAKYVQPLIGNISITEISSKVAEKTLLEIREKGRCKDTLKKNKPLSFKTVEGIKGAFQVCMQIAFENEIIPSNPLVDVKLPKEVAQMNSMDESELIPFLESAKRHNAYEFYFLELSTGMKLGEIAALEWDDLDAEKRTIRITKQVQRYGNNELILTPPTAPSYNRTLSISQECVDLLLHLKDTQPFGTTLMFPSRQTKSYKNPHTITSNLHRIQDDAGLERIKFNDLRHTFAILALKQGMDITVVSQMLGHSNPVSTMRRYTGIVSQNQDMVAYAMANLLLGNDATHKKKIKFGK